VGKLARREAARNRCGFVIAERGARRYCKIIDYYRPTAFPAAAKLSERRSLMSIQQITRFFVVIASVIALLATVNGQALVAQDSSDDVEQKISDLLDQYTKALLDKDSEALDRIWADDLSFINLHGELLTKQNRMDNIKTGATAFKSIELTDKKVRVYGEAAVATCKVVLEAQYSGQEGSGPYRVTTVWARSKDSWQMVAVQMTRIE
jgi:ketosteroid isomerase-like protein